MTYNVYNNKIQIFNCQEKSWKKILKHTIILFKKYLFIKISGGSTTCIKKLIFTGLKNKHLLNFG